jgi:hypothetical protein
MRVRAEGHVMRQFRSTLCLAVLTATAGVAAHADDSQPVNAVWKRQEIEFFYQGFTSIYTCDGIEDRVEAILRAVGAKDVKAVATGCVGNAPTRSPHVHIVAKTPVEATPEVIAELQKTKTQDELKSKVRNEPPVEATAQFPATWKRVNLSVGKFGIEENECELIEEMNRKVFPKLAIRTVKNDTNCIPHQRNIGQPRLQVDALTAQPSPDDKAKAS